VPRSTPSPRTSNEILRRTMQLEIEREALKKEKDAASRERLAKFEKELAELRAKGDSLKAQWQAEKQAVNRLRGLRQEMEQTKTEIDKAEREYDLNRAAELRYGKLAELERKLASEEQNLTRKQGPQRLLKEEVDEEDI